VGVGGDRRHRRDGVAERRRRVLGGGVEVQDRFDGIDERSRVACLDRRFGGSRLR
jgi:hypothetical protein